jgi:hypothetical protein
MRFISTALAAAAFVGVQTAAATVRVEVDLGTQTMHVSSSHGDYDWPVSTGRPGFRTPTGAYRPQRMYEMTHSNEYDNAPMPHAIFFSGGYAIHGTYSTGQLGRVASHGCIRLAPGHAAALYRMVQREGASIVISGQAPGGDEDAQNREGGKLTAKRRGHDSALRTLMPHPLRFAHARRFSPDLPLENQ